MTDPMDDLRLASADVSGVELTDHSHATQAVLDAFRSSHTGQGCLAAALRAAADQVVPEDCLAHLPNDSEWQTGFTDANTRIRFELLAIAIELEAQ